MPYTDKMEPANKPDEPDLKPVLHHAGSAWLLEESQTLF